MQRLAASPSSRTMRPPQTGQVFGMRNGFAMRALHLDADHFRNHVAAAFHDHGIADLQPQPRDFVFVMERRARNRDSADHFGREVRDRRQRACSPHLHGDVE